MSAARRRAGAVAASVGALVLACAPYAPGGWLSTPEVAQQEAYGGWLRLELVAAGNARPSVAEGELLAITPDTLFIIGASGFRAVSSASVTRSVLEAFDAKSGLIAGTVVLGTLSTASNGVGLILTAPIWIIVGSVTVYSALRASRVGVAMRAGERWDGNAAWAAYRPYARFPAGLPPGLDRNALRARRPLKPPRDAGLW